MAEELFEVVDEEGITVGEATRREVHGKRLLHRVVHVFVLDHQGRLVLQRRSRQLRVYPGLWTSSATGHVDAGEDVLVAAHREFEEEVGAHASDLVEIAQVRHDDLEVGERKLVHAFVGWLSGEPAPDPKEVAEVRAFPLDGVATMIEEDASRFAPSFLAVLPTVGEALAERAGLGGVR